VRIYTLEDLNPNAIQLLEKNLDKVNWRYLSKNPNIFEYDYKAMKDRMFNNGRLDEKPI
jgi:hypothetical protein